MTRPEQDITAAMAARGYLLASHADREQMIDVLKTAYVQGRLTREELDARVAQTLASRTYTDLVMVTVGLRAEPVLSQPSPTPSGRRPSNAARWATSGLVTPVLLGAAYVLAVSGSAGYEVLALILAGVYFVFWLSAGADLLWQWHCMCVAGSQMCVRCAHTVASHRSRKSCSIRLGSLRSTRCSCSGYVPPGLSPEAADLRPASTR